MKAEGIETARRILCVFPRYTSSFGTFEYAYPLTDGVQAFMPPQGLLLIAAYLPTNWSRLRLSCAHVAGRCAIRAAHLGLLGVLVPVSATPAPA